MSSSINRTQFLRGNLSGQRDPIRPPWSLPESQFVEKCNRCADCVPACEYELIKIGRGGYPEIDFSQGGCDFCTDCVAVCIPGAISNRSVEDAPWELKATILDSCLSINAVICRSCGEACDQEAIKFKLEVGGIARPLLDLEKCNGCGECFTVCPDNSVQIAAAGTREQAALGDSRNHERM